ncbi:hypothetical protein F444_03922 [Phytophthora nicotianae P1976]|uniref:Uncharacterized protein n=1 Tax=Phytophthora nicotianae P1976 TaxID=1317066 RepID=A0A081ASJ1_PHYNI|nr:hypothetical protein F444_03922 [Phytophthora nicotianae P1976]
MLMSVLLLRPTRTKLLSSWLPSLLSPAVVRVSPSRAATASLFVSSTLTTSSSLAALPSRCRCTTSLTSTPTRTAS